MLTRAGAWLQAFLEMRRIYGLRRGVDELVIFDDHAVERPWGWVFPIGRRDFTGGDYSKVTHGGGLPSIIVDRLEGTASIGSRCSPEESADIHESLRERRSDIWDIFLDEPAPHSLDTLQTLRRVLGLTVIELGELRGRLPGVWKRGARVDLEATIDLLRKAGIRVRLQRPGFGPTRSRSLPMEGAREASHP